MDGYSSVDVRTLWVSSELPFSEGMGLDLVRYGGRQLVRPLVLAAGEVVHPEGQLEDKP